MELRALFRDEVVIQRLSKEGVRELVGAERRLDDDPIFDRDSEWRAQLGLAMARNPCEQRSRELAAHDSGCFEELARIGVESAQPIANHVAQSIRRRERLGRRVE